jgi:glutathione peroxidase
MALHICTQQLRIAATCARVHTFRSVPRHLAASRGQSLAGAPVVQRTVSSQSRSRSTLAGGVAMAAAAQTLHDFQAKDIDGKTVDLSKYKGKVLLVVNVASECGFTKQYTGLAELHDKYKGKGFEVLAFPCNQFGGQEPGSSEQIKAFAKNKGASFQMFDKVDVNGANADPVWQHLKSAKGGFLTADIKWNFSKFLVDKDGNVAKRYGSTTTPEDIEKDVLELL